MIRKMVGVPKDEGAAEETGDARGILADVGDRLHESVSHARDVACDLACGADIRVRMFARRAASERGQGTTEYAILVGVLVVIAIVAVTAFRGRLQELWSSIADGVNSL